MLRLFYSWFDIIGPYGVVFCSYLTRFSFSFEVSFTINIIIPWEFFTSANADGFHWSLSDSKSPQVSRTLLSILTNHINVVVWMVFTRPFIFKSSCHFINPLVTVSRVPIIIGISVTFMFHSFFSSLARSWY